MIKFFVNKKNLYKGFIFLITLAMLSSAFQVKKVFATGENEQVKLASGIFDSKNLYQDYMTKYQSKTAGIGTTTIEANKFVNTQNTVKIQDYQGEKNTVMFDVSSGELTYSFEVSVDGRYRIGALYYPIAQDSALDINLSFKIDGAIPFDEAQSVFLSKIYANETNIVSDISGNDLRPNQIEKPQWRFSNFIDNSGFNPDPFEIFLTKGQHTLSIKITQETISLKELSISGALVLPTYENVKKTYEESDYIEATGAATEIRAELAYEKSSSSIYPNNIRANAAIKPSDPSFLKLNVISASQPGEWMSWSFKAPKSGLYRLGFRVLQDSNRGMVSTFRLLVNGSVPFKELNVVEFPYSVSWYNYIVGGNDPYLFYFEAGKKQTITIECTTGRFSKTLGIVRTALYDLNTICHRLTMVTGITPDIYRDYDFKAEIPDLNERLILGRDTLKNEMDRLNKEMNYKGSELVVIEDIIRQIDSFIEKPRSIPSRLSNFRTNISTLGTWMLNMTRQGIVLDSVLVLPKDTKMDKANASFWEQFVYDVKAVLGSFMIDYTSIGTKDVANKRQISVWISAGRDQANIIRRIVDDDFAPNKNISAMLSLVADSTTLLQATLANKGPDVALFVEKTLPVNLAARGALCDLSTFKGYEDVANRFYKSALIPYEFNKGIYAIPNSQGFNVMFIRTDIFTELHLAVPKTWDEFYKVLPAIQRSNMQVGALGDQSVMFETLILQHGGKFYKNDLSATDFSSKEVLDAFKMWTGFYKEYSLPITYDAFSYFRSGIMPLLIADYTQYNQFVVAAPEIKGLWSIYPIPGLEKKDKTIDHMESATGTASILMKSTKDKNAAFEFIDWWTTTKIQTLYSRELESIMGPAARYNSANVKTLENLAWRADELKVIMAQWKDVTDIKSIPSSYYVTRNIANAFRAVVFKSSNERETLNKYSAIIDKEIIRKNKELGILH